MKAFERLPRKSHTLLWALAVVVGLAVSFVLAEARGQTGFWSSLASAVRDSVGQSGLYLVALVTVAYYSARGRSNRDDRATLADSLADMVELDVPLPEALRHQVFEFQDRWATRYSFTAWAVARLAARVERGSSLAEAVAEDRTFPTCWPVMLRTAESSGRMVEALRSLALLERDSSFFSPDMLLRSLLNVGMLALLGTFLMRFIMPTFVSLLDGMNDAAGADRVRSLAWAQWIIGAVPVAMLVSLRPWARQWVQGLAGRVPVVRDLTRFSSQSTFCTSVAGTLRMGVTLDQSLHLAAEVVSDPGYQRAVRHLANESGDSLEQAMGRYPTLFCAPLRSLAGQGERFGTLPDVLSAAASWLREEADGARIRLRTMVHTGLLGATGLCVGYYAVTVMGALMTVVSDMLAKGVMP
jgi:type IV pilus assembly protein PilC